MYTYCMPVCFILTRSVGKFHKTWLAVISCLGMCTSTYPTSSLLIDRERLKKRIYGLPCFSFLLYCSASVVG